MRSKATKVKRPTHRTPYKGDSYRISNNKAEQRQRLEAQVWQQRHKQYLPLLLSLHADLKAGATVANSKVKYTSAAFAACKFMLDCPDYSAIARECYSYYNKAVDTQKLRWYKVNYSNKVTDILPVGIRKVAA